MAEAFDEIVNRLPLKENLVDMAERIARAWFTGPDPEFCEWDAMEDEDRVYPLRFVTFVLMEAGIE